MSWKIISAKYENGQDIPEAQIEADMPTVGKIANKPAFAELNNRTTNEHGPTSHTKRNTEHC